MAKKDEKGTWTVKCPICSWKKVEDDKQKAENSLANHIEIVHKEGRKGVGQKDPLIAPSDAPPGIPPPVKERS
jgi:hypothetical protein